MCVEGLRLTMQILLCTGERMVSLILQVIISLAAAATYFCTEVIPLNPICPLSDDVVSITHDIVNRRVEVKLREDRLCWSPSLILRLSGPALYKLDYQGLSALVQTFTYPPLIDSGEYFLEAVVIYCNTYLPNSPTTQCVENHHHGRNILTLPYSFTVAVTGTPRPRWKRAAGVSVPLATRHQRFPSEPHPGLKCDERYAVHFCRGEEAELVPYLAYDWTDPPSWLKAAMDVHESFTMTPNGKTREDVINVCFVGDSHSGNLFYGMVDALNPLNLTWLRPSTIDTPFPVQFNVSMLDEKHCSVAIFSFAIWPLSNSPFPHTAEVHFQQMTTLIEDVQKNYHGPARMFFRSENINGLGAWTGQCPANHDRRSPPAFDAVNAVTRQVCKTHNVPFIDLDPIIYPMWDAALDFCHPPRKVFVAEAEYILHVVFNHIVSQRWQIPMYSKSLPNPPMDKHTIESMLASVHNLLCRNRECRPLR